ncbi:unnamed protein product [Cochlearia groenlandica]
MPNEDLDEIVLFKAKMSSISSPLVLTSSTVREPNMLIDTQDYYPLSNWKTIADITKSNEVQVQVRVSDHSGSTSFLLFDREMIQLINKAAYELLEQQGVNSSEQGVVSNTSLLLQMESMTSEANYNELASSSPLTPSTKRGHQDIDDEGQVSSTKGDGKNRKTTSSTEPSSV